MRNVIRENNNIELYRLRNAERIQTDVKHRITDINESRSSACITLTRI